MGPTKQGGWLCLIHGPHFTVICPRCVDDIADKLGYTVQRAFCNEVDPISLGRWEEQTEYDRDFLASCGIRAE